MESAYWPNPHLLEAHPEVTQMRALRRVVVEKPKSLELRGFERVDRIC